MRMQEAFKLFRMYYDEQPYSIRMIIILYKDKDHKYKLYLISIKVDSLQ